MTSPPIDVANVTPGTLMLQFASSWRDSLEGNPGQTANLEVAFDGGEFREVMRWESDPASPNFKDDATDELVRLTIDHPADARQMSLKFGLFNAGNDWWWAIDNLSVLGSVFGDFTSDGRIDVLDLDAMSTGLLEQDERFDWNADGQLNLADRKSYVETVFGTWLGDADLDGLFQTDDLVTVFTAGLYESGNPARWDEGDWNGDRRFDSGDIIAALIDGGYEQGRRTTVPAVPEPATWLLAVVGPLAIAPTYRRRSTSDRQRRARSRAESR
jgi:hypothetical protein